MITSNPISPSSIENFVKKDCLRLLGTLQKAARDPNPDAKGFVHISRHELYREPFKYSLLDAYKAMEDKCRERGFRPTIVTVRAWLGYAPDRIEIVHTVTDSHADGI